MSHKEQKNFIIPDELAQRFNYWCKRNDVNMSQQIRKLMRGYIIQCGQDDEVQYATSKNESKEEQTELFPELRESQEEQSSSDEGRLSDLMDTDSYSSIN